MEYFGAKFSIALGAWKLRFVLMLEDAEDHSHPQAGQARAPHHLAPARNASHVR